MASNFRSPKPAEMEEDKDWSAVGEVAAKEGKEHVVSLLENEAVFQGKAPGNRLQGARQNPGAPRVLRSPGG